MKRLGIMLALTTTVVTLISPASSPAATRARFRAETILNDFSTRLASGFFHTCQINQDGTVRCWGNNSSGQLGNGTMTTSANPVPVSIITNAVAITAGQVHSCALLADGTVKCWGSNLFGQLGDGTTTNRTTAVGVSGLSNAVAIAAGRSHTCALLADGTVRCWGSNQSFQLGINATGLQLTPVATLGLNNAFAVAIAAGGRHTCALLTDGRVRCWGKNDNGQVGDSTAANRPVAAQPVVGVTNAVAITGGDEHSCALLANGTVRCWGSNALGRLGDNSTTTRFTSVGVLNLSNAVAISGGGGHTCALVANGTARCWGGNVAGQIGNGTSGTNHLTPVPVGTSGNNTVTNAVTIAAGFVHTCAFIANGSAKCWGSSFDGQVGDGTFVSKPAPVQVLGGGGTFAARDIAAGRSHTCAVRADGTVRCWGNNGSGQLGDNGLSGSFSSTPVPISVLANNHVAVAGGEAHTCALLADGLVKCWGLNSNGQLGDGTTTSRPGPVTVPGLSNVIAVATGGALGSSHTCALIADGTMRCWGANGSGQLGDNTTLQRNSPVVVPVVANAVAIAVGEFYSCALIADGTAKCWGFNSSGQLGNGTTGSRLTATNTQLVNGVSIAGGNSHACALLAGGGNARCWGANLLGQVGNNTTVNQLVPVLVVDGTTPVANMIAIAGGFGHTCAVLASGGARCWGDNSLGQLGNNTTTSSLRPVVVGSVFQTIILSRTGSSTGGTLVSPLTKAVTITAGRRHTCALIANGGVSCWGDNGAGQIGNSSTTSFFTAPVSVPSFNLNIDPNVTLEHSDRVSTVTILAACDPGQRLRLDVTLTQGAASGNGHGGGECTGALEGYPVTVPAHGRHPFVDGPAVVKAEALIVERGLVVDTQEWMRDVDVAIAQ